MISNRSGENCRHFTVARFSEEEGEPEDKESDLHHESSDSVNVETSDYHSATSSDCGSDDSSDAEEEIKGNMKEKVKDEKMGDDNPFVIAMKPRVRETKPRKIPTSQVRKPPKQKIFCCVCYLEQKRHFMPRFLRIYGKIANKIWGKRN